MAVTHVVILVSLGSPTWDQQATTASIAEYCLNKAISFSLQRSNKVISPNPNLLEVLLELSLRESFGLP